MAFKLQGECYTLTRDKEEIGQVYKEEDGTFVAGVEDPLTLQDVRDLLEVMEDLHKGET